MSSKENTQIDKVVNRNVVDEMKKSYIDYAMSTITSRALSDIRDGLKPVHRRILFTMSESNFVTFVKSARVAGEVISKYHPHGTAPVYGSMVNLTQEFSTRYPMIIGQGNFGSIDGDNPADMRYTECKMSKISQGLLLDIEKETVDFILNYDATKKEPVVLPSVIPNILINGTSGIAVGMASNIAPHNLEEVYNTLIYFIDNQDASIIDLVKHIKGPDFPTGGVVYNYKDIINAYSTGRGGVVCRGEAEIIEKKAGQFEIIISSIPYKVNKANLVTKIAELVKDKKLDGLKEIRDESKKEIRVVLVLKNNTLPEKILNNIYKHTQLESVFNYNMVVLVNGVPETVNLKKILTEFVKHRFIVVVRRITFLLKKAKAREHILLGLKLAIDNIDKIIKLIRSSADVATAQAGLMEKFKLSKIQANAILEMRLQKLAGLEQERIEKEVKDVLKNIKEYKIILNSDQKVYEIIKSEFEEIKNKYKDPRRTKIIKTGIKDFSVEDLIPDEEVIVVLTNNGYIKRNSPDEFKNQKRGGVGVSDINVKEDDYVHSFIKCSTHSEILLFTDKGKVYQMKVHEIPDGKKKTRGKSVMNFLPISSEEKINSILKLDPAIKTKEDNFYLCMTTSQGIIKKTAVKHFCGIRKTGMVAINLKNTDSLVSSFFVYPDDSIFVATSKGQSIRFLESNVRPTGRSSSGVLAIRLFTDDKVISSFAIKKRDKSDILVVSEKGYGKRTDLSAYKIQSRAGKGVKTFNIKDKNGLVVDAKFLTQELEEIVVITKKSKVIRISISSIKLSSRTTQGISIAKVKDGDKVSRVVCL